MKICQVTETIMIIRNLWFEIFTFFSAMFTLACAISSVVKYIKGEGVDILVTVLAAGVFLLLTMLLIYTSLMIGSRQKRDRDKYEDKFKKK
jgi:hypothetical protein